MQISAYTLADGRALLKAAQDNDFAQKYFGCEIKKCEELVSKMSKIFLGSDPSLGQQLFDHLHAVEVITRLDSHICFYI